MFYKAEVIAYGSRFRASGPGGTMIRPWKCRLREDFRPFSAPVTLFLTQ